MITLFSGGAVIFVGQHKDNGYSILKIPGESLPDGLLKLSTARNKQFNSYTCLTLPMIRTSQNPKCMSGLMSWTMLPTRGPSWHLIVAHWPPSQESGVPHSLQSPPLTQTLAWIVASL